MMKSYPHLNDTYISGKLKKRLMDVSRYPVTTVIAPTGYGKTTAMKWWNEYRKRYLPPSEAYVITVVEDSLPYIWTELCRAFEKEEPDLADKMRQLGYPDSRHSMMMMVELWERSAMSTDREIFFVLDDVQILDRETFVPFLMFVAERLAPNVHVILISRDRIFSPAGVIKMGRSLLSITGKDLQLGEDEVISYGRACGLQVSGTEAALLTQYSGGWISLIYLIFCLYAETGRWQTDVVDVDCLIREVMIDPLTDEERDFITVMSVAPEFTADEAAYIWDGIGAGPMLRRLSGDNAFITCSGNGVYRFHNLLRTNTEKMFSHLAEEEQERILIRLGDWHMLREDSLGAMRAYSRACDWDRLLDTMAGDRGSSIGGSSMDLLHEWAGKIPDEVMKRHPAAALIFALHFFTAGDMKRMMELKELVTDLAETDEDIEPDERDSFRGEVEILMSFLKFNDIEAMSVHHRKASSLMKRHSILVNSRTPWTFGSPSVLMLYHRTPGGCEKENGEMRICMPHYYRLTSNHGYGAEHSMEAETFLMQGRLRDAEISYYQACHAALSNEQYSILITAEFTAMRMNLIEGEYEAVRSRYDMLMKRLGEKRLYVMIPTAELCGAWVSAVLGHSEIVPSWIMEENADESFMTVARPVFNAVKGQVLMAMKKWTLIISRADEIKAMCDGSSMLLCGIYTRIHTAGACLALDRDMRAYRELKEAMAMAEPDGLILPFAENGAYIRDLLMKLSSEGYMKDFIGKILELDEKMTSSGKRIGREHFGEMPDYGLTLSERDIAVLAAERRTTREIARTLHLSENTVKTHLRHIFAKLNISGTARNKRDMLEKLFSQDKD